MAKVSDIIYGFLDVTIERLTYNSGRCSESVAVWNYSHSSWPVYEEYLSSVKGKTKNLY